jgi:hypothetical protein
MRKILIEAEIERMRREISRKYRESIIRSLLEEKGTSDN